ncbi:UDP-N-acetylmuramate--L-alanine ligase [Rhodococcus sp. D2-41]|uniref:UDP-N-acetylmuramate--L-alanine ligase n=1 Tax=Speluncibacter jeojiensis TaxID=2710754 RepID=A0A9X4LZM3_9ACTN|nr:UDP-N-acetylmuramate--L-alanine ligase [Rhodococcus sp. D2-41]MDG3011997.1 UDP-N-acetylmuramate--L-alanine ligase [Rhodococcus sp. D2-41]MDG3013452.1 UDP-N-acetylmuramate--L-alanine ligase [Corynebacteriales bacterium D3-21]
MSGEQAAETASGGAQELPEHLRRVHMIGIGGAGMSGIARILLARGGQVSGSDAKEGRGVLALRARGAQVRIGHDPAALDMIDGGPTCVVSTQSAIPKTNPELLAAADRGIPVILRPAVLASLMEGFRSLLVAGTHGKTSTTSMLVVALQHCGVDPSFVVGGELNEAGTNAHHGNGDLFVAEADESDGSLLQYSPRVVVVTNVDADHLDFFGSLEAYVQVFDDFVDRIEPGGLLVACLDDPGAAALAVRARDRGVRVLGYGSEPHEAGVEVGARLLQWRSRDGGGAGTVQLVGEDRPRSLRLEVPGRHMALNALGALLAAREVGAAVDEILDGLAGFGGVHRRFQFSGRAGGVRVYDDYAHHPTEVTAVLGAARDLLDAQVEAASASDEPAGRVIVVFQPHLYSRTQTFAGEFAAALSLADEVIVLDVYAAREEPLPGVSGALIAGAVTVPVHYQPVMSEVANQVAELAAPGDVVMTMGAGDVTMLGNEILDALRSRQRHVVPGRAQAGRDRRQA